MTRQVSESMSDLRPGSADDAPLLPSGPWLCSYSRLSIEGLFLVTIREMRTPEAAVISIRLVYVEEKSNTSTLRYH